MRFSSMVLSRRRTLAALASLVPYACLAGRAVARPRSANPDSHAFLDAVVAGDVARVRGMLERDAALAESRDEVGRSAFVLAHLHGRGDVADVLRATGLELDVIEAVLAEDWKRVEALAGDEPELMQRAHPIGGTPLYAAALVGSLDGYRLRGLGCDPNLAPPGGSGFTPARGALESVDAGWARLSLCDLLANGGDANARQRDGSSVLHGAVARRDETLVRLAIRKGAAVGARDDEGRTAQELATGLGWAAGAKLLADHASLPRDNRSSRFAFDANRESIVRPDLAGVPRELQSRVTSASHAKLDVVRGFVEKDPRLVFSISTDDELAIEACAHTGMRSIIRFHLDHGAPLSLPTAVSLGDVAAVTWWLDRDATLIHERGAHDFPLMWFAVLGGLAAGTEIEMSELLVRRGASPDQETAGSTALHLCAMHDARDLAAWLLERGADPAAVGRKWHRDGRTPLQIAEEEGHAATAAILRDAMKSR